MSDIVKLEGRKRVAVNLATVERFESILNPVGWDDQPTTVDRYTRLLPVSTLKRAIAELEAALQPADGATATKLAQTLVGAYPAREVTEPAIFGRAIGSIFAEHAPDVGRTAVDRITRDLRFLPTRADVHAALTKLTDHRRGQLRVARAQLAEHERRAKERDEPPRRYADLTDEEKRAHDATMTNWRQAMAAVPTPPAPTKPLHVPLDSETRTALLDRMSPPDDRARLDR